jgi:SAM-dependent methyltransferase
VKSPPQAGIQSAARWIKRENSFRSKLPELARAVVLGHINSRHATAMSENSRNQAYIDHVSRLEQRIDCKDTAMRLAVGGEFNAVGKLEYHLLRSLGLSGGHLVIDVGCGSGRLAQQLVGDKTIRYVGTDVAPRLLESAKALTARNDWEFHLVEGICIPCPDSVADFVTFFSVLTHTTHIESFRYFQEAARCLKPGGYVVVSFLEFRIPCHWETFLIALRLQPTGHLIQFVDRDALAAWATHSGLVVESFFDGDKGHIPIPEEIRWENGTVMKSSGNLGQSVAVLRKG